MEYFAETLIAVGILAILIGCLTCLGRIDNGAKVVGSGVSVAYFGCLLLVLTQIRDALYAGVRHATRPLDRDEAEAVKALENLRQ